MLSQFEGKRISVTTEDGEVFTGTAETFPSGYGLHEFGREEESVQLDDLLLFRSEIRKIELLPEEESRPADPRRFDALMGELLEGPYRVVDVLPEQVPAEAGGRYFAVEHYFLRPARIRALRRRYAELLLRLNCYYEMTVSFDGCESWETDPDPEAFAARLEGLAGNEFLRAVFEAQRAMIDIEPCDLSMTVYDPGSRLTDKLRALAGAEGFFVWSPPER